MFKSLIMSMIFSLIVVAVNVPIVKYKEEQNLEARFSEEYKLYKRKTPFLIPNFSKIIQEIIIKMIKF